MAETFYGWIGNLACYYLVYSIAMNVIPKKEYQAYVKSFMGMLLVILLLTPVMEFLNSGQDISAVFQIEEMKREWEEIRAQEETGLRNETDEYFLYACREEISGQIRRLAEELGYEVESLKVELDFSEEIKIDNAEIILKESADEEKAAEELKTKLTRIYKIREGDIHVGFRNS
ncbi:MAG: stage III sporulation protein AF [Ruminococcus sp.]|jgi:stage III sporulation protein AF